MIMRLAAMLCCLAIAGCAVQPPPDTAVLPFAAFGTMDNDVAAANHASWAFASPLRTQNNPVAAARAVAAIDYLGGELSSNPRWMMLSLLTKHEMLRARAAVRQAVGIRPDAPSQFVVDALMQFAADWQSGNQATAMQVLAAPIFTQPPAQTLQALSSLPYIQSANIATADAASQILSGGDLDLP